MMPEETADLIDIVATAIADGVDGCSFRECCERTALIAVSEILSKFSISRIANETFDAPKHPMTVEHEENCVVCK